MKAQTIGRAKSQSSRSRRGKAPSVSFTPQEWESIKSSIRAQLKYRNVACDSVAVRLGIPAGNNIGYTGISPAVKKMMLELAAEGYQLVCSKEAHGAEVWRLKFAGERQGARGSVGSKAFYQV